MIDEKIKSLVSKVTELIEKEKNSTKSKPGKMSLLSMFRHGHENSHSDVLRYLLDPKEDHKHKDEYLKLFLEEVGLDELIKHDLTKFKISREYSTKQGRRIDIFIEFDDKTCIIIENKIWAKDQHKQLLDYYQDIKNKEFTDIHILYLTLPGYKASEHSLGKEDELNKDEKEAQDEMVKLEEEGKFLNISYGYHILSWLKQLSFKSNEHTLRSAIEQYIYNIEILTKQTEEDINMIDKVKTELKDLLDRDPKMWETLYYLEQATQQIRQDKVEEYKEEYKKEGEKVFEKWKDGCAISHEIDNNEEIGNFVIDLIPTTNHVEVCLYYRDKQGKKQDSKRELMKIWLKENGLENSGESIDPGKYLVIRAFPYTQEKEALKFVTRLNELFKEKKSSDELIKLFK